MSLNYFFFGVIGSKELADGILHRNTRTRNEPRKTRNFCKDTVKWKRQCCIDFLLWPSSVTSKIAFFFLRSRREKNPFLLAWLQTNFLNVVVENNQTCLLRRQASVKRLCYLKLMQSFFYGEEGGVLMGKGWGCSLLSLLGLTIVDFFQH